MLEDQGKNYLDNPRIYSQHSVDRFEEYGLAGKVTQLSRIEDITIQDQMWNIRLSFIEDPSKTGEFSFRMFEVYNQFLEEIGATTRQSAIGKIVIAYVDKFTIDLYPSFEALRNLTKEEAKSLEEKAKKA